jgi:hypothetical protein
LNHAEFWNARNLDTASGLFYGQIITFNGCELDSVIEWVTTEKAGTTWDRFYIPWGVARRHKFVPHSRYILHFEAKVAARGIVNPFLGKQVEFQIAKLVPNQVQMPD